MKSTREHVLGTFVPNVEARDVSRFTWMKAVSRLMIQWDAATMNPAAVIISRPPNSTKLILNYAGKIGVMTLRIGWLLLWNADVKRSRSLFARFLLNW